MNESIRPLPNQRPSTPRTLLDFMPARYATIALSLMIATAGSEACQASPHTAPLAPNLAAPQPHQTGSNFNTGIAGRLSSNVVYPGVRSETAGKWIAQPRNLGALSVKLLSDGTADMSYYAPQSSKPGSGSQTEPSLTAQSFCEGGMIRDFWQPAENFWNGINTAGHRGKLPQVGVYSAAFTFGNLCTSGQLKPNQLASFIKIQGPVAAADLQEMQAVASTQLASGTTPPSS